jgi:hypothetical protein
VFVYVREGTWKQKAVLSEAVGQPAPKGNDFGGWVSVSSDAILVSLFSGSGAVCVYDRTFLNVTACIQTEKKIGVADAYDGTYVIGTWSSQGAFVYHSDGSESCLAPSPTTDVPCLTTGSDVR